MINFWSSIKILNDSSQYFFTNTYRLWICTSSGGWRETLWWAKFNLDNNSIDSQCKYIVDLCGTPGYLAPETLKCNMFDDAPGYSREVDIWACGVIMFTLLVGCPPFWHRKQMIMLRNIMEGKYSFMSPEWSDISGELELIQKN